jgi:predicted nucleic acid-binding protein
MIILDTNVLSELMRPAPSQAVRAWVASQPAARLYTTTITQAEILYGLALMTDSRRRSALTTAAKQMFTEDFAGRLLAFDAAAAEAFAPIAAARRQQGRPIATLDAQIAAIAASQAGELATRNVSDFLDCGIHLINPWEA